MKTTCCKIPTLMLLAAALLLPSLSEAKRSPGPTVLISPDESEPFERRGNARISLVTGAPLALYNVDYRVSPGPPEMMARQYLRENFRKLRLRRRDLADLAHHATREGDAGTTVRFSQRLAGLPVYGAGIAVTINDRRRVTYVASSYKPAVQLAGTQASIDAGAARQAAHGLLAAEGGFHFDKVELVVYHNRGLTRLAFQARFSPRVSPAGDWEVLVDAHSGEIFKAADMAYYGGVDGTGTVFDPDPLSSAGATYGDPGFTDGSDADTTELNGELVAVTLPDIELTAGVFSLIGPFAEIVDHDSPFKGLFSQMSSAFDYNRFDDAFEAANTYWQIDNFMRYMNVTLGCDIMPYQYPGGVQFDPHGWGGADNSSYSSGSGRLSFGEGGVDDAEDADVIIHELGHGIHDWVTVGGLSQVEGLSEGSGDYLAQSYSRSLGQWGPGDPAYHWVFSWDGHNPFWPGRITNYGATYPGGLIGQIHTDGQIWSTCNMLIWDAIGREATDKAFLEGLGMTGSGTNQEDAAQAVLQAATDLGYTGAQLSTMASIYQGCGYQVETPTVIFTDGFESGDTTAWSASVP